MSEQKITLSPLGHTWIFDLDGTLVRHNGYKERGEELLPGAKDLLGRIPAGDMVVIVTARKDEVREQTEEFLRANGIRYDHIIFNAPYGERIVVNDRKPSGLNMSVAVNLDRDEIRSLDFVIDETL